MGTPIDQIEYGDDCSICPSLFPPGQTPKLMYLIFHGVEKCNGSLHDPPNDIPFVLEQSPVNPCFWYNPSHPSIYIIVEFHDWYTLVEANFLDPPDEFFNALELSGPCIKDHIANGTDCEHWGYVNGEARVYWEPDSIPFEIAVTQGWTNQSDVLSDRVDCGIDHQIIKLTRRIDKTNVLFLVDCEEFI